VLAQGCRRGDPKTDLLVITLHYPLYTAADCALCWLRHVEKENHTHLVLLEKTTLTQDQKPQFGFSTSPIIANAGTYQSRVVPGPCQSMLRQNRAMPKLSFAVITQSWQPRPRFRAMPRESREATWASLGVRNLLWWWFLIF